MEILSFKPANGERKLPKPCLKSLILAEDCLESTKSPYDTTETKKPSTHKLVLRPKPCEHEARQSQLSEIAPPSRPTREPQHSDSEQDALRLPSVIGKRKHRVQSVIEDSEDSDGGFVAKTNWQHDLAVDCGTTLGMKLIEAKKDMAKHKVRAMYQAKYRHHRLGQPAKPKVLDVNYSTEGDVGVEYMERLKTGRPRDKNKDDSPREEEYSSLTLSQFLDKTNEHQMSIKYFSGD